MAWILQICYTTCELNYYYEDGYRTYSALYTSGYLQTGGSVSAGATINTIITLDANGYGTEVYSENYLFGPFASSIAYDLQEDGLAGSYDDLGAESDLQVCEYMANGTVKIAVCNFSDDSACRAKEEALIHALIELGAEQISLEEMEALCSGIPDDAEEVTWLDWNDGNVGGMQ